MAYSLFDYAAIGSEKAPSAEYFNRTAVRISFGCQTSVTGLFRTQLANGIIGMSGSEESLPALLRKQKLITEESFGLCFLHSGGVMTLGGVESNLFFSSNPPNVFSFSTSIYDARSAFMQLPFPPKEDRLSNLLSWVKLVPSARSGWYTVRTLGILMVDKRLNTGNSTNKRLLYNTGAIPKELNSGKGTIIDSGTTDTFLPKSIAAKFKKLFKELTGVSFQNKIVLTLKQKKLLPDIVFRLRGDTKTGISEPQVTTVDLSDPEAPKSVRYYDKKSVAVDVVLSAEDYIRHVSGAEYEINLFLTEKDGTVLGANFMNKKYIVFDREAGRIGFASSSCMDRAPGNKTDKQNNHVGLHGKSTPSVLNNSNAEYWRLIGWRRLSTISSSNHDPMNHGKNMDTTSKSKASSARIPVRKIILWFCKSHGAAVSAQPVGPCSASCQSHDKDEPLKPIYPAFGKQNWECVYKEDNEIYNGTASIERQRFGIPCSIACGPGNVKQNIPTSSASSWMQNMLEYDTCPSDHSDVPYQIDVGNAESNSFIGNWSPCDSTCLQSQLRATQFNKNASIFSDAYDFQTRTCFSCIPQTNETQSLSMLLRFYILHDQLHDNKHLAFTYLDQFARSVSRIMEVSVSIVDFIQLNG